MCSGSEVALYYAELGWPENRYSGVLPLTKVRHDQDGGETPLPAGKIVPQSEAESPTPTPKEE